MLVKWHLRVYLVTSNELEGGPAGPALRRAIGQLGPALGTAVVEYSTTCTGLVVRAHHPIAHWTDAKLVLMERFPATAARVLGLSNQEPA